MKVSNSISQKLLMKMILELGEEYSFFVYPNRSGDLFATQNMPDITKDKYDFAKVIKPIETVHILT